MTCTNFSCKLVADCNEVIMMVAKDVGRDCDSWGFAIGGNREVGCREIEGFGSSCVNNLRRT